MTKIKSHSVPTTPLLQNHFDVLSPTTTKSSIRKNRKNSKKKKAQHKSDEGPSEQTNEQQQQQQQQQESLQPISFLEYLKDELTVADFDSAQELKRERVTNFLGVPGAIEKVMKL
ncbi:hypothetical protein RMCBS344292_07673 [Rhizopus microsporus]|nr:hypothetical protein RMCBS344292_07673 [Rhizopus microsporus]